MMKQVIILGTGGNCAEILETLHDINDTWGSSPRYECIGFLDDDATKWGQELHGVRVLGPLESARDHGDACVFVNGIGSPNNFWRKPDIIAKTGIPDGQFEAIVHPSAYVSRSAQLGPGTVILHHCTVSAAASVGKHVIVLSNSIVSHHDVIGDYTCVARGVCISGNVTVSRKCYLGTNSSIIGNTRVGENCLIGIGSVVLKDVPDNSVVAGNPARFLRHTPGD